MTVVVGTAGHIDHGKTALLRVLTGIDADRLPEERRRGMTIDVGYAHLDLPDGRSIDFVDVPGHDRLVGNMLVGAGEIDAALLVVALDDGPRAQTLEHLELLDALRVAPGVVAVTKADLVPSADPRRDEVVEQVRALVERTSLAGAPILLTSAETGEGLEALRAALLAMCDTVEDTAARRDQAVPVEGATDRPRLAIDRVFAVRGRGTVVTGTLRGGGVESGRSLRLEPGAMTVRIRGIQVHGGPVERAPVGRTALNLAGLDSGSVGRGQVLSADPAVVATDRLLAAVHRPVDWVGGAATGRAGGGERRRPAGRSRAWPPLGEDLRLHLGTAQAGAVIRRPGAAGADLPDGSIVVELRLDRPIAVRPGDRLALRRPSPATTVAGGRVLDPRPPTGPSRRRATRARLVALAEASDDRTLAGALVGLHGALPTDRWSALVGSTTETAGPSGDAGPVPLDALMVDGSVADELAEAALETVAAHHRAEPDSSGVPIGALRTALALGVRRRIAAAPPAASGAASALIDQLLGAERLERDGDRVRLPGTSTGPPPVLAAAMDRLEALLAVPTPPPFGQAVSAAGCPPEGVRSLETSGRIVRLDPELAFATTTYRALAARALALAADGPLSPAAFRDASGSSRKYALAILEDLDRRGVLRRTPEGHLPGPRAGVPGAMP